MGYKKCLICGSKYSDKLKLVNHINKAHSDNIPNNWTASRYENYLRSGMTHGKCVECKRDTEWNEYTMKYHRYCTDPKCKQKAREKAKTNYINAWGKVTRLDEPEVQKRMVYGRKNSGEYKWSDRSNNEPIMYDSSYGLDFLKMCDLFLNMDGHDMMGPSPNVYYYKYENKDHFYIPDFYIPSLNLEVEIKDGGDNPNNHPKIQAVDKVKESLKDEVVMKHPTRKYIKICNKDYSEFFTLLLELRNQDETLKFKPSQPDEIVNIINDKFMVNPTTEAVSSKVEHGITYIELLKELTQLSNASFNFKYVDINQKLYQLISDANTKDELIKLTGLVNVYRDNVNRKTDCSGKKYTQEYINLVLLPTIQNRMMKVRY